MINHSSNIRAITSSLFFIAVNKDFHTEFDPNFSKVNLVTQDIERVFLLIHNDFQACAQKKLEPRKPLVTISSKNLAESNQISNSDSGPGIPDSIKVNILQPFFNTKPRIKATGVGLNLRNDIINAHGGEIKEAKEVAFVIFLHSG